MNALTKYKLEKEGRKLCRNYWNDADYMLTRKKLINKIKVNWLLIIAIEIVALIGFVVFLIELNSIAIVLFK